MSLPIGRSAGRRVRGDAEHERRVVHALRSAAANVGAQQLADAARQLEQILLVGAIRVPGATTESRIHLLAAFSLCWESAAESLDAFRNGIAR